MLQQENNNKEKIAVIKKIVSKIVKEFNPEKVILFGSYARGDYGIISDLDILIIMYSKKKFVDRIADMYKRIKPNIAVDFLVYTPVEIERMKKRGFIKRILREGKVLYEKRK